MMMMSRDTRLIKLRAAQRSEEGYTLVALLALMTILVLALSAAAPSIQQQVLRARESEAIARGEEVAEAIAAFHRVARRLPTKMEELLEGVPLGTKKIQILRPSAAIDPLSSSGEWRLIRPGSPEMTAFQQSLLLYTGGTLPHTREPTLQSIAAPATGLVNTATKEGEAPGGEETSTNTSGSFIGVASRSRRASVLTYYGIERHDQWVFTPLFK